MKRTRNMIYNETTESRELFLYATNHGGLYRGYATPIIRGLRKKAAKGIYDRERAVDIWYKFATVASDLYKQEFGYAFTVQARFTAAADMAEYYEDEIFFELNN